MEGAARDAGGRSGGGGGVARRLVVRARGGGRRERGRGLWRRGRGLGERGESMAEEAWQAGFCCLPRGEVCKRAGCCWFAGSFFGRAQISARFACVMESCRSYGWRGRP